MEKKKGRMERVYSAPGKKAPESKIKGGGKATEAGMKKHMPKTPRMGG
jgi:hypothetical protein